MPIVTSNLPLNKLPINQPQSSNTSIKSFRISQANENQDLVKQNKPLVKDNNKSSKVILRRKVTEMLLLYFLTFLQRSPQSPTDTSGVSWRLRGYLLSS